MSTLRRRFLLSIAVWCGSLPITFVLVLAIFYGAEGSKTTLPSITPDPLSASGGDLLPLIKSASILRGNIIEVYGAKNGDILLLLDQSFPAADYPFVEIKLGAKSPFTRGKLLWRNDTNESVSHSISLVEDVSNSKLYGNPYQHPDYSGVIKDVALLFYPDLPAESFKTSVQISSVTLLPSTFLTRAEHLVFHLLNPPLLSASSTNFVSGATPSFHIRPNMIFHINILVSFITLYLSGLVTSKWSMEERRRSSLVIAVFILICAWASSEALRWCWRLNQFSDTHERFYGRPLHERYQNDNIRCQIASKDCAAHLLPYF